MKRNIINIDQKKCTGCGLCIPGCPEGAIQLIDGKARLVSDLICDGLGACLGHCPEGAITIEEREAEPYDEKKVMQNIAPQGLNTIKAHLKHLQDHGQTDYYNQALDYLREHDIQVSSEPQGHVTSHHAGCPGSRSISFAEDKGNVAEATGHRASQLTSWPVQMHLISPNAPHFRNADLLLAADCVAFSAGDFHKDYLQGKVLAIACPKLDDGQQVYLEKLVALIEQAEINSITVIFMQVPCCSGLLRLAQQAVELSARKVPVKAIVIGIRGEKLREEWVKM
ncbi:MAG TPA: 4Fe-4S dicluster domain-containing protein [bacterium]|nr:4Fe-4S dicluster domain-containing protein [bacterium]HPN44315.1 4Fe-4S dicluster domain-containing protein [bacterium]